MPPHLAQQLGTLDLHAHDLVNNVRPLRLPLFALRCNALLPRAPPLPSHRVLHVAIVALRPPMDWSDSTDDALVRESRGRCHRRQQLLCDERNGVGGPCSTIDTRSEGGRGGGEVLRGGAACEVGDDERDIVEDREMRQLRCDGRTYYIAHVGERMKLGRCCSYTKRQLNSGLRSERRTRSGQQSRRAVHCNAADAQRYRLLMRSNSGSKRCRSMRCRRASVTATATASAAMFGSMSWRACGTLRSRCHGLH